MRIVDYCLNKDVPKGMPKSEDAPFRVKHPMMTVAVRTAAVFAGAVVAIAAIAAISMIFCQIGHAHAFQHFATAMNPTMISVLAATPIVLGALVVSAALYARLRMSPHQKSPDLPEPTPPLHPSVTSDSTRTESLPASNRGHSDGGGSSTISLPNRIGASFVAPDVREAAEEAGLSTLTKKYHWMHLNYSPTPEERRSQHAINAQAFDVQTLAGVSETQGPKSRMEDAHHVSTVTICGKEATLHLVADGHGGGVVSVLVAEQLPERLAAANVRRREQLPGVISRICEALNSEIKQGNTEERYSAGIEGTTLTGALVFEKRMYVFNNGDSRTVIIEDGRVLWSSADHTPDPNDRNVDLSEVTDSEGNTYVDHRLNGYSTGSHIGGAQGEYDLPCQTDVTVLKWGRDYTSRAILVMACDGLWDVATNEEVALAMEKARLVGLSTADAAATLVDAALVTGSTDNTTVMVAIPHRSEREVGGPGLLLGTGGVDLDNHEFGELPQETRAIPHEDFERIAVSDTYQGSKAARGDWEEFECIKGSVRGCYGVAELIFQHLEPGQFFLYRTTASIQYDLRRYRRLREDGTPEYLQKQDDTFSWTPYCITASYLVESLESLRTQLDEDALEIVLNSARVCMIDGPVAVLVMRNRDSLNRESVRENIEAELIQKPEGAPIVHILPCVEGEEIVLPEEMLRVLHGIKYNPEIDNYDQMLEPYTQLFFESAAQ